MLLSKIRKCKTPLNNVVLTLTLGEWVPIVAWVPEVGGLCEELLLGTQLSCLLILDNTAFREYLFFTMDRVEMEMGRLLKVTVVSIFKISYLRITVFTWGLCFELLNCRWGSGERAYVVLSVPYICNTSSQWLKYTWDSNIEALQENNPQVYFIFMTSSGCKVNGHGIKLSLYSHHTSLKSF